MAVAAKKLETYRAKRDFSRSPEPQGGTATGQRLAFVIQKHDATRLHYDFRLEWDGVLKSWAVTRGPSMDPADKRLAVEVEDHPLDYGSFEGIIPEPGYGAGTVMLWDQGSWAPLDPKCVDRDLAKGELKFVVSGERLKGGFVLVRLKPKPGEKSKRNNWLLIKEKDSMATPGKGDAVLKTEKSVKTGRTMAQIAKRAPAKEEEVWHTAPTEARDPMPDFVAPQLCQLVATPPEGKNWIHELKLDGYRLQLRIENGKAALRTRTGLDWTARFPTIAKEAAGLPDGIIDGEAVALDADNQPSFGTLQAVLAGERKAPLLYWAFDLLHDGQRDLRHDTQLARKEALKAHLPTDGNAIRYLDHFTQPGQAVLASACRLQMEGIVSKRADAPYIAGRGSAWTKAKCRGRDEFLIGGWARDKKGKGLGSLLMGAMRGGKLVYLGRVGTGFSGAMGQRLMQSLEPLKRKTSPFIGAQPARLSDAIWAEPKLVAEIAYGGFTEEGILRHASFQGLREDKPPEEVTPPEKPQRPPPKRAKPALALTHPEKVLWPATDDTPAVTKGELGAYYERFADRILAEVAGRPISLLRAPDGIGKQLFFQRHAMPGQSPLIRAVPIEGQPKPYMRIDDAAGLAALAQVSVVEIHPWGAKADRPETPDRLIFDLDPAPELDFDAVITGAIELRERLKALGLTAFPRATGGKGLHLVVPIAVPKRGPAPDWAQAKQFARLVCAMMEKDAPKLYTTTLAKKARTGRIFLDYLRNDRLSTAIASWSPRGRAGAPIAHPIKWSEVKAGLDPAALKLPELLDGPLPRDPWTGFGAAAGSLRAAMEKATG